MRSAIPVKNKSLRRVKQGQALVEAVLNLSLLSSLVAGVLGLLLLGSTWVFLSVDSFLLARAHLYGQQNDRCHVSTLWPTNIWLRPWYRCDFRGSVSVRTEGWEQLRIRWEL